MQAFGVRYIHFKASKAGTLRRDNKQRNRSAPPVDTIFSLERLPSESRTIASHFNSAVETLN